MKKKTVWHFRILVPQTDIEALLQLKKQPCRIPVPQYPPPLCVLWRAMWRWSGQPTLHGQRTTGGDAAEDRAAALQAQLETLQASAGGAEAARAALTEQQKRLEEDHTHAIASEQCQGVEHCSMTALRTFASLLW